MYTKQEAQRATYRAPEYNVPPFLADWPGRPSCFSDRSEKHKLGRGRWDLASCQVSLNSIQRFQRRSQKCLSQSEARAAILFFPIGPKNTNFVEDIEILFSLKFRGIPFSGFRGEVENVSANQRPGRPSCFSDRSEKHKLGRGRWDLASCQVSLNSIQRFQRRSRKCLSQSEARAAILFFRSARKNTNLVEDVEILLPVKFRWIPFSGFRGEVENVSANQRPGRPSCFSDRSEKHKLGRGRWDLASCQVSLNSVQRFQRRSRKCLSQSEAWVAIFFFRSAWKNTNLVEDIKILLPVKFRWIPFSGFRGEVRNVSANQRPGRPSCFSDRSEKHKLGRGRWDLASCKVSLNSIQRFQKRSRKCLSQSEARAAILFFWSVRKNTNLVEDVEILLPVKFRWIPFSGFRGEVENVSANQRPGRPSCFSNRPEKHKLGRGRWDLASCQVSLNSVQRFQRRSRKCLSQSEARAAILFFRSARKTQTW